MSRTGSMKPHELMRHLSLSVNSAFEVYNRTEVAVQGLPFAAVLAPHALVTGAGEESSRQR